MITTRESSSEKSSKSEKDETFQIISNKLKKLKEIQSNISEQIPDRLKDISEFNSKEKLLELLQELIIQEEKYDKSQESKLSKSKFMKERLDRVEDQNIFEIKDREIEKLTTNLRSIINSILTVKYKKFVSFINIKKMISNTNTYMIFFDSLMVFPGLHISYGPNTPMHLTINFPYDWNFNYLFKEILRKEIENSIDQRITFLKGKNNYIIQIKYRDITKDNKHTTHEISFENIPSMVDYIYNNIIGKSRQHIISMYTKPALTDYIQLLFSLLNDFNNNNDNLIKETLYIMKQGKGKYKKVIS